MEENKMKTRLLLIIAAVALLPLGWAGAQVYYPPDSCLKMYCDNDWDQLTQKGSVNPDSVRVDSCENSPTYGKLFAKKYFILQFQPYYYPFDKVLKPDTIKRVADISIKYSEFKTRLEQLEDTTGTIYFQGLINDYPDSSVLGNPGIRMFFEKYQECEYIMNYLKDNIDSLDFIIYDLRATSGLVSIYDITNTDSDTIILYPNPVINNLFLENIAKEKKGIIEIYSFNGRRLLKTEFSERIDISFLSSGIYLLKCNNKIYKFIKL